MSAIWKVRELRPLHHSIIWWIIDGGALGKILANGWQKQCAQDLGVHRLTIRAAIRKMEGWGIILPGEKRGEVILNPVLFVKEVDRSKLTVKERKQ